MNTKIAIIWLGLALPIITEAQNKRQTTKKAKSHRQTSQVTKPSPAWAKTGGYNNKSHVYFPDYYAFYDPQRGYVFWNAESKTWNTSHEVPSFMSKVDMSHVRVQILDGLSLDLRPETNYPNYMKLYPSNSSENNVPVPRLD